MLLKWGGIALSIVVVAGVVGLVRGGVLPDSCSITKTDRAEPSDPDAAAALADRLAALDAALADRLAALDTAVARQDVSRAIYEWREAYGLALRARGWDAMIAVGDAAVRVDTLMGGPAGPPTGFRAEARRAYLHALLRARRDRSRAGVNQIADAFAALGDDDAATYARTLGMGH